MATEKSGLLTQFSSGAVVSTLADGMIVASEITSDPYMLNDGYIRPSVPAHGPVVSLPADFPMLDLEARATKLWEVHDELFVGIPPAPDFLRTLLRGHEGLDPALLNDVAAIMLLEESEPAAVCFVNDFLDVLKDPQESAQVRLAALTYLQAIDQNYNPLVNLCDRYGLIADACVTVVREEGVPQGLANSCMMRLSELVTRIHVKGRLEIAELAADSSRDPHLAQSAMTLLNACRSAYPHGHGLPADTGLPKQAL